MTGGRRAGELWYGEDAMDVIRSGVFTPSGHCVCVSGADDPRNRPSFRREMAYSSAFVCLPSCRVHELFPGVFVY